MTCRGSFDLRNVRTHRRRQRAWKKRSGHALRVTHLEVAGTAMSVVAQNCHFTTASANCTVRSVTFQSWMSVLVA